MVIYFYLIYNTVAFDKRIAPQQSQKDERREKKE